MGNKFTSIDTEEIELKVDGKIIHRLIQSMPYKKIEIKLNNVIIFSDSIGKKQK